MKTIREIEQEKIGANEVNNTYQNPKIYDWMPVPHSLGYNKHGLSWQIPRKL